MYSHGSLIVDIDAAIQSGSNDKRAAVPIRITDLFRINAYRFSDEQIVVVDNVLGHLLKRIEKAAFAERDWRLAPFARVATETMRRLARDNEIAVADPILAPSDCLTSADLVEMSETKSQAHLLRFQTDRGLENLLRHHPRPNP